MGRPGAVQGEECGEETAEGGAISIEFHCFTTVLRPFCDRFATDMGLFYTQQLLGLDVGANERMFLKSWFVPFCTFLTDLYGYI